MRELTIHTQYAIQNKQYKLLTKNFTVLFRMKINKYCINAIVMYNCDTCTTHFLHQTWFLIRSMVYLLAGVCLMIFFNKAV